MTKIILTIIVILLTFPVWTFSAETLDIITLLTNNDEEVVMKGSFANIGKANPGDALFFWMLDHHVKPTFIFARKYVFLGRTGDKTYEIQFISSTKAAAIPPFSKEENKDEFTKMNMFFDKDSLFELKGLFFIPKNYGKGCTADDKLYLKMLSLKGNELQYQIILPECLKFWDHKDEGKLQR